MWHVPFSRLLVDQSVSNKTSQDHSPSSLVCNRGYVTHVIDGMTLRNGDDPPGSESCPKKTWLKPQEKMRTKPMKKNMWQPSKPTKYGYIYMCVCADTIIIKHGHFNQQKYSSTIKDVGFTMFQQ